MKQTDAFTAVRPVADAVLYEGYLLYPYRRSSGKNRVRWQFGVLAPKPWLPSSVVDDTSVAGSADAWRQQTECLLEASQDAATVRVCLRFLQMQHRSVQELTEGGYEPVDELRVDETRYLTFDEAVPREHEIIAQISEIREAPLVTEIIAPGAEDIEHLGSAGRIVRTSRDLRAEVRLSVTLVDAPFPLLRLSAEVCNTAEVPTTGAPRAHALLVSLIATHSLLHVENGRFISLLDPPEWATAAAKECKNIHTFPVMAGDATQRDSMLSSPILMDDNPRVAPESPGDLFDATEIDEILSLRTLTLTDEEKLEARATDPRAAEIIDRVDGLPPAVLGNLHGTIRSRGQGSNTSKKTVDEQAWWKPGGDDAISPETDSVLVDGVTVSKGSRVRLNPRKHGTDVHDMFLVGRTARVEAVLTDVDGSLHVAVSVDDDPGADIHSWYGRHYHFSPDELTVLDGEPEAVL